MLLASLQLIKKYIIEPLFSVRSLGVEEIQMSNPCNRDPYEPYEPSGTDISHESPGTQSVSLLSFLLLYVLYCAQTSITHSSITFFLFARSI